MPNVSVTIGGRDFEVACQEGEEHYLKSAAALLDAEASAVVSQIGRMPEQRMLLMAGLMLADKAAGVDEQLQFKDEKLARLEAELAELRARSGQKETVEVPVVPDEMVQNMAELAARAEAMADAAEERAAG